MPLSKEEYALWITQLAQAWDPLLRRHRLALEEVQEDVPAQTYRQLRRQLTELEQLLTGAAAVARMERGHPVLQLAAGEPASWLNTFLSPYQRFAAEEGVQWEVQWTGPWPDQLCTDQRRVESILKTLIENAFSFLKPEAGKIMLQLAFNGESWSAAVTDNGIGIAEDKLPQVFNPLYAEHTHLQLYQAAHLQLFLAKGRAQAMRGDLQVESRKGVYTRFILTLPFWTEAPNRLIWEPISWRLFAPTPDQLFRKPDRVGSGEECLLAWISAEPPEDLPAVAEETAIRWQPQYSFQMALLELPALQPAAVILRPPFPDDGSVDGFIHALLNEPDLRNLRLVLCREEDHPLADRVLPVETEALEAARTAILLLNRERRRHPDPLPEPDRSEPEVFMVKVRRLLDSHLADTGFGVRALADALYMSRSQLHRKISRLSGMNPQQLLLSHRLEKARKDLASGLWTVAQVADRCGFSSPAYFSRIYRSRFGRTPKEDLRHR